MQAYVEICMYVCMTQAWNGAGLVKEVWSNGAKIVCTEEVCECSQESVCLPDVP
jgi:hypothetical protein